MPLHTVLHELTLSQNACAPQEITILFFGFFGGGLLGSNAVCANVMSNIMSTILKAFVSLYDIYRDEIKVFSNKLGIHIKQYIIKKNPSKLKKKSNCFTVS